MKHLDGLLSESIMDRVCGFFLDGLRSRDCRSGLVGTLARGQIVPLLRTTRTAFAKGMAYLEAGVRCADIEIRVESHNSA